MSWTTPKNNWANGDYYNFEDHSRIYNNLQVLVDLACDLFGDKTITYLIDIGPYEDYPGNDVYAQCDLSPKNMEVSTDSGLVLDDFSNLNVLCLLDYLTSHYADEGDPEYIDGVTDQYIIGYDWGSPIYFVGYAYIHPTLIPSSGYINLWPESNLYNIRPPFYWSFTEHNYIIPSFYNRLMENQPFRTAAELNQIETLINTIHNRFIGS